MMRFFQIDDPDELADVALDRHFESGQKIFGWITFSLIFGIKLELLKFFLSDNIKQIIEYQVGQIIRGNFETVKQFASAHGLEAALAFCTYIWFVQLRDAVKNEKLLLINTYKKMNVRKRIGSIFGYRWIKPISIGISLIFIVLSFNIDDIQVYAALAMIFCAVDIFGNGKVRDTLVIDFVQNHYAPADDEKWGKFAMDRAIALQNYWVRRPQVQRIALVMIGFATILLISTYSSINLPFSNSTVVPRYVPYIGVMSIILINKYTMIYWRKVRDKELRQIDDAQAEAEGMRVF